MAQNGSSADQLRRTVVAWTLVVAPGEECVLWDLDKRVGVEHPGGLDPRCAEAIQEGVERVTSQHL